MAAIEIHHTLGRINRARPLPFTDYVPLSRICRQLGRAIQTTESGE